MTLRPAPTVATWFLRQFGSSPENESITGDLIEQYQRGRGWIWYWRQVLAIVFMKEEAIAYSFVGVLHSMRRIRRISRFYRPIELEFEGGKEFRLGHA